MGHDPVITAGVFAVAGVLLTQAGQFLLQRSNAQRIRADLQAQNKVIAAQGQTIQQINVNVNGNLTQMRADLQTAVARIIELTETQEKVQTVVALGDAIPTKALLTAAVAEVALTLVAAPDPTPALQEIVARVQAAAVAEIPTTPPPAEPLLPTADA